jgi:CRISPR-associated protein Csd2
MAITLKPPLALAAPTIPIISARDPDVSGIFPAGFDELYEIHSYRNAARILSSSCKAEFREIVSTLMAFRIPTDDLVVGGGNKSRIAIGMENRLKPLHWLETRIVGDLQVRRIARVDAPLGKKKGPKTVEQVDLYQIPGFVDGHKVDFVKGRVAFDMEWNSKDQTFDRDLYAVRAFYDCNVVTAGVLLTRSSDLVPLFEEIGSRVDIANFKSKFGASTTWMKKLTYRLDAGRAGGCPILAIGIRPAVISDFEKWKRAHPKKRNAPILNIEGPATEDDDVLDELPTVISRRR